MIALLVFYGDVLKIIQWICENRVSKHFVISLNFPGRQNSGIWSRCGTVAPNYSVQTIKTFRRCFSTQENWV